jgi:hypothetical protein
MTTVGSGWSDDVGRGEPSPQVLLQPAEHRGTWWRVGEILGVAVVAIGAAALASWAGSGEVEGVVLGVSFATAGWLTAAPSQAPRPRWTGWVTTSPIAVWVAVSTVAAWFGSLLAVALAAVFAGGVWLIARRTSLGSWFDDRDVATAAVLWYALAAVDGWAVAVSAALSLPTVVMYRRVASRWPSAGFRPGHALMLAAQTGLALTLWWANGGRGAAIVATVAMCLR